MIVIGAGVIGLAVARALARAGREVVVLESAAGYGSGISSRNSEVIHAGLYGEPDALKTRLCVRGRQLLYRYCETRHVAHQRCGKLLVATRPDDVAKLQAIAERAAANGVHDLRWLAADEARRLEPELACVAALHSPSSGIVDSHGLMTALLGDAEAAGALLAVSSPFAQAERTAQGWVLATGGAEPFEMAADWLVNCAGLDAQAVARCMSPPGRPKGEYRSAQHEGTPVSPHGRPKGSYRSAKHEGAPASGFDAAHIPALHLAKGNYFSLAARPPFRQLVYPMPVDGGLGVHLTLDLGGQAKFGPDVQWLPASAVGATHAIDYAVDASRGQAFEAEIRRYWPGLPAGALQPAYSGVRPKLSGPGQPAADFHIAGPRQHGCAGVVQLFGIESPGLTSALAIAELVLEQVASAKG